MPHAKKRKKATRNVRKAAGRIRKTSRKTETTTAIVPVTPAPLAPLEPRYQGRIMPREKVELIKRTVCKEGDDNQLALFLHSCEAHGLDPFRKQIYAIFFNNDESRAGKGQKDMVMITGIDGFSMMAARDHKDFGGVSSAKFTWFEPKRYTPDPCRREIPETATVTGYRKGGEPVEITVYWEEYAPKDLTDRKADFWKRMPKNQLEKCAQAKAYRRLFPGQGNIFVIQEMSQKVGDTTTGGRQIVDASGFSPSGEPVTHDARKSAEVAKEVDRQKEEHSKTGRKTFAGTIEIDHSRADEVSRPSIHCSQEILDLVKSKCSLVWGKDEFWHPATGKDYGIIRTICDQNNFEFVEIVPTKPVTPKNSGADRRPDNKAAQTGKDSSQRGETQKKDSAGPRLLTGCRVQVCQTHTSANKKTPYMTMLVKTGTRATWMDTWDHTFFMWFTKAKEYSVECGIYVKDNPKYNPQIVGIEYIGDIKFRDMKHPIKPEKKDPGQEGLFK